MSCGYLTMGANNIKVIANTPQICLKYGSLHVFINKSKGVKLAMMITVTCGLKPLKYLFIPGFNLVWFTWTGPGIIIENLFQSHLCILDSDFCYWEKSRKRCKVWHYSTKILIQDRQEAPHSSTFLWASQHHYTVTVKRDFQSACHQYWFFPPFPPARPALRVCYWMFSMGNLAFNTDNPAYWKRIKIQYEESYIHFFLLACEEIFWFWFTDMFASRHKSQIKWN